MEVDFFKDLETEIKRILKGFGYPIPSFEELRKQHIRATDAKLSYKHYDIENLVLHFLTVTERRIPIKKWNIHISPQLQNRTEIVNIVSMLSKGIDANSLLSNRIKSRHQNDKYSHDLLRYEWGIYHLHFTKKRSKNLLFAFIHNDDIYLLDILPHQNIKLGIFTWTDPDLIQTLHDNWPHVISGYIYRTGSKESITPEQRKNARENESMTFVTVNDGTEYMPMMGGGFTTNNHLGVAITSSKTFIEKVRKLEQYAINSEQGIKEALNLKLDDKIEVRLFLDSNYKPQVYEVTQKTVLDLLPPNQEPIT
ncbi:hypothetical protein [Shewanella ulleungensis]|uniref:hypothetical protein n=1 Tax=Shewanella ulleungensis TaxID=2282699 RepID=UPI003D79EFEF